jgi:hypothetical protein
MVEPAQPSLTGLLPTHRLASLTRWVSNLRRELLGLGDHAFGVMAAADAVRARAFLSTLVSVMDQFVQTARVIVSDPAQGAPRCRMQRGGTAGCASAREACWAGLLVWVWCSWCGASVMPLLVRCVCCCRPAVLLPLGGLGREAKAHVTQEQRGALRGRRRPQGSLAFNLWIVPIAWFFIAFRVHCLYGVAVYHSQ